MILNSCFNALQTTAKLEVCKTDHWLRASKLSLNYNKTNFMLNSQKHNPTLFKVRGRWGTVGTFLHFQPLLPHFMSKQAQNLSHNKATLCTKYHVKA